ncbi:MAG: MBL fold metallo-hydrolase [Deltaproteobacteria bacterium]|nr:MBL fold metallo-hydrolase [Deltaproteobacteria bacterium]
MPEAPLRVTWIRTSTLLVECGEFRVLTDPWFGRVMRIVPVFAAPGVALEELPPIDLLLVSHLHADHFSLDAARAVRAANPRVVAVSCPGSGPTFARAGVPVTELAVGRTHELGPLAITAVRCRHTGPPPEEVNFVVRWEETTFFFGGDARLSDAFAEVGRTGRVDVAALPIGGTRIFGTRTTMDPADALTAARALGARFVIPIHEGMEWMPVPPASWHPGRTIDFERLCGAARDDDGAGGTSAPVAVRLARGERATFTGRGAALTLGGVERYPAGTWPNAANRARK